MESFSKKEKLIFINSEGQAFEISVLSPFFIDRAEGLDAMENDIYTTTNYNQDGVSVVGESVRPRNIIVEGRIRLDKEINRSKMIRFFVPKRELTLKYTNGEIERFIRCRVEKTPVINKEVYPKFIISFLCPNPWWFAKEFKSDLALWVPTFEFPLEIPEGTGIQLGYREPSLIVNVVNESDNPSPMRVEFRALGTVKNPYIINVETREMILIEREMIGGDVITVNTANDSHYVELNRNGVVSNVFNDLSLESEPFLKLNIGDNLMRYDAEVNIDNLEVSIYFSPQYVGV